MPNEKKPKQDKEEEVLTPGGMRPKSAVHHVEPGQAVEGDDVKDEPTEKYEPPENEETAGKAEPPGMRPASAASAVEPVYETKQAKTGDEPAGDEPAGMRPKSIMLSGADAEPAGMRPSSATHGIAASASASSDLVRTPGGYRHKAVVHLIEPEHFLELADGNLRKMHISGKEVRNYGRLQERASLQPLMPGNVEHAKGLLPSAAGTVPAFASGWISYAWWTNNTGHPVSRFSTTWVVPPAPATNHNQTIFLFNGIQNSTMIYQPVLQWGPSAAGGGAYWSVASWYVDGQGGVAFHTNLVKVNPGDVLVGVMRQTGSANNKFSYNCDFTGIANTSLPISNVEELTWNIETLEAYGIQACSDYPDTNFTAFTGIDFQTSAGRPALTWTAVNAVTDCGQNTRVVSNSNPGGEVDIYYTPHVDVQAPTAAINSDGRLETFMRATNGVVWNIWQKFPHAGPWSRVNSLGGIVKTPLCSALNTDGRLEIFGIGTDNAAYNIWQTVPHAGPWSGWNRLGGWVDQISSAVNSDGRLEVFGVGSDRNLYNIWQTVPHAGPWSGWNRLT